MGVILNTTGRPAHRSASVRQHTLNNSIHCSGIGLHSGRRILMSLHPAPADSGIVFRRSDVGGKHAEIAARYDNVADTRLCTSLSNEAGVSVSTVEHLMAAFAGCEIDNALVELNGPEVPIMDGSAGPFVFLIECAGTVEQDAPRRVIRVLRPVTVTDKGKRATIAPAEGFSISLGIDFDNAMIGRQDLAVTMSSGTFKAEISRARTFGFLHEVEAMRSAGLARGGSLDNAVVVSGDRILNEDGLRYEDEFVRHKILDCVGDLYLAGGQIIGRFTGSRIGHGINNKLLRALFADPANWTSLPMDEPAGRSVQRWQDLPVAASA